MRVIHARPTEQARIRCEAGLAPDMLFHHMPLAGTCARSPIGCRIRYRRIVKKPSNQYLPARGKVHTMHKVHPGWVYDVCLVYEGGP